MFISNMTMASSSIQLPNSPIKGSNNYKDFNGEGDDDDDDDDDLNCPFSEKQAQWLMLQFCPVTVGVTEWNEFSRFNHLF